MPRQPNLETTRLLLRPFRTADADDVQRLAGDRDVADTTLKIPHPYEDGMAEKWIANHRDWFDHGQQAVFAVTRKDDGRLLGAIGLRIERDDQRAELGYWIGKPYWGQGFCTEAARAILSFGFEQLGLHRVQACHFTRNRASGRVLQKVGMTQEGRLREHSRKWDAFEDIEVFGLVADERRDAPRSRACGRSTPDV
jgi:[ribosomal protein S5]-alanine N-acetyltransferase